MEKNYHFPFPAPLPPPGCQEYVENLNLTTNTLAISETQSSPNFLPF